MARRAAQGGVCPTQAGKSRRSRRSNLFGALVTILVGFMLAAACASTHVTNTWKNPAFGGQLPHRILVVGMLPNEPARRQVEQVGAAKLDAMGVQAVPSFAVIPESQRADREAVNRAIAQNGFDGVLIARYTGTRENINYVPGPYWGYGPYLDLWGAWGGWGPGYVQTTEEHQMETSLFDTRASGQLIWSGTSSTFSSGSARQDLQRYISTVVGKMERDLTGHAA
jgi:hypothetical protein